MRKKGFTLAELMGVLIILGVIALIVFPAVTKTIRTSKEKAYEEQKNIILKSAKNWGVKNAERLSEFNSTYLSIEELKKEGYIEVKDIINPLNEKEMDGCVAISYDGEYNQYVYQYYEDSCDNVSKVPVITMNGDSSVIVFLGDIYEDAGATAVYDGKDVSDYIVTSGSVNTDKVGTYYIRYNVSYNEKKGDEVVRTVKVIDNRPVITLKGDNNVVIGINNIYNDAGATAKTYDGIDISSNIVVTSNVDTSLVGVYTVKYDVISNGKSAEQVVRTVKVIDDRPVITLKGDSIVTVRLNETYADAGASAKTHDGIDISNNITSTSNVTTATVGTYTVRYNVMHNGKSADEVVRTVKVVDKNPIIVLSRYETSKYEKSVTVNVTVTPYTGNSVSSVVYKLNGGAEQTFSNNSVTLNTSGLHTLEVVATDNEGNVGTLTSGIYRIDNESPKIALSVSGSPFNASGWAKTDVVLNVTTSDTGGSLVNSYKYCTGSNCTPTTNVTSSSGTITLSTASATNYVCAFSVDNAGNESEKVCAGPYKIDKTTPTLTLDTGYNLYPTESYVATNMTQSGNEFTATKNDQRITFKGLNRFKKVTKAIITFEEGLSEEMKVQIYYAVPGGGFSEANSVKMTAAAGTKQVILALPEATYENLRFDIGTTAGQSYKLSRIDIIMNDESEAYTKGNVMLYLNGTAGISGINSYSFDNGSSWQTNNYKEISSNASFNMKVKNNADSQSSSIEKTISKIDKVAPTLTVPANTTILLSQATSYNLLTGVSVTDNNSITLDNVVVSGSLSAIEGDYTISYTVTDKAGNAVTKNRTISVAGTTEWTFTEDGTFTVPVTGTYTIEMHGGGGGGAGGFSIKLLSSVNNAYADSHGTGGGGSGEIYTTTLNAGDSYPITIGAGGSGGSGKLTTMSKTGTSSSYSGNSGSAGGTTSFGTLYSLAGGGGASAPRYSKPYSSSSTYVMSSGSSGAGSGSLANQGSSSTNSSTGSGSPGGTGGSTVGSYGDGGRGGRKAIDEGMTPGSGSAGEPGAIFIKLVDTVATSTLNIDTNLGTTGAYAYNFRSYDEFNYGNYYQGEVVDLSDAAENLSLDGYVLLGFNTDPNASNGGYRFVMGSNDTTLYAIWAEVNDNKLR